MLKWPPKEARALSRKIQERFKARTPKGKEDHYLRVKDTLTDITISIPYANKEKARKQMRDINRESRIPPEMEVVSLPRIEDGEYIKS